MGDDEIIQILSQIQIDLFERFSREVLSDLVRACPIVRLEDGQVLFEYGSAESSLYVVLEGSIQVYRNGRLIETFGPREYLGELALIEVSTRSASARAVGPVTLLEISLKAFDTYLRGDHEAQSAMLRTMCQRLRKTSEKAQASYEEINLLVHDMLNSLVGFTYVGLVMEDLPPDDKQRVMLQYAMEMGQTMEVMLHSALRRARGISDVRAKELVKIDDLIQHLLRELAPHADLRSVTIKFETETPIVAVSCNVIDIKRLMTNLILNAAQAMPSGGTIRILVAQRDRTMTIRVIDDGPGVPEDLRSRIFEPHFTTKSNGNGLGLSSCRGIVEHGHNGKLRCESSPGKGATFICELPMGREAQAT